MTARRTILPLLILAAASTACVNAGEGKQKAAQAPMQNAASAPKIVAYYFHMTFRCTTCRTIEAYSRDTILGRFKSDMDRGRLEWHVVNVQLPENEHFVKDYQLFTKSVVLVHMANGKRQSYKVLNDVWELVGDKAKFQGYVEKEVRGYLARL